MKFFTPKEIAAYCKVDKVTPIRWIHDGDLPAIKKKKRRVVAAIQNLLSIVITMSPRTT